MEGFGGLAGAALSWREFDGEDGKDLLVEFRDLFNGGVPEDLPVEVEVDVDDPMADSDDLSPRDFRVSVPERN